jgi:hypothetical protein
MSTDRAAPLLPEPLSSPYPNSPSERRAVPRARVRVPLTLTVRPWATLYVLPDGRRWWCLRLRENGTVRTRCVSTDRLRSYARRNGLAQLERELGAALAALPPGDRDGR